MEFSFCVPTDVLFLCDNLCANQAFGQWPIPFSYSNNKLVTRRPVNVKVGVVLTWVAKGGFNSIATEEQELHQPGCYKPSCSSHTHHLLCYCFTHSFSSLVSFLQKLSALWFESEMIDLCAIVKDAWISQQSRPKRLITLILCWSMNKSKLQIHNIFQNDKLSWWTTEYIVH